MSRMFTSPDPSSNSVISYDVYAAGNFAYVSLKVNEESLFYLDLFDKSSGDYLPAFDNLIAFLQEARDEAMVAERGLKDRR